MDKQCRVRSWQTGTRAQTLPPTEYDLASIHTQRSRNKMEKHNDMNTEHS